MSEPKRGEHSAACVLVYPFCLCNTYKNDKGGCCFRRKHCYIDKCKRYIADEPTKKGAEK